MSPAKAAPVVRFEATPYAIDGSTILRLPEKASNQLPSRGKVAVQATVNGHACQTVAEPDGESGHWVRIDAKQQLAAALRAGDTAEVELVPLEDQHLEDAEREAPTVLFQPDRVHRPGPFEEREANRSAMIGLAYAMSEPCGPWGVSLG